MTLAPCLGYERWADTYDDQDPSTLLDEPLLLALAGDVQGRRVLDVACGTGRYARLMWQRGADVIGVDASRGMLVRARRSSGDGIRWVLARADALPFACGRFDLVTCGLLLDHVDPLPPVFAEISRVLVPRGRAIVSTVHPTMQRFTGATVAGTNGLRIDGVLHKISDIESAACSTGLKTCMRCEPCVTQAMARLDDRWQWRIGLPALLVLALDKR
jgi:ubiquinone/menaquinone biosynthesis C-methylase UbiE